MLGTAGHVDHGKSSLVKQLTGVDPDRWQEEKDRGLTIDLGFAPFRLSDGTLVGMVDVPGHERFLKNMVAGATSVDLAVLVVAADDGVMPQTREHHDVLDLLGVRRGIVALTKVDLADDVTVELAEEEIRELLAGGPLEGSEIVRLSSVTGEGIDRFKSSLERAVQDVEARSTDGVFRMPVQRVFSLHGFGSVLTGIPLAGEIAVGEQLEVVGKKLVSRIRGIHAYGQAVDKACAGHSTALNLPDVPLDRVERGDTLSVPGALAAETRLELEIRAVGDVPPLKHGEEVHLHLGTKDVLARVFLLDRKSLPTGNTGLAQVLARQPVVVIPGDFVLLRRLSPARTIAGGRVIGVGGRRLRRFKDEVLEHLQEKERVLVEPAARVSLIVTEAGEPGMSPEQCAGRLGWTPTALGEVLSYVLEKELLYQERRSARLFGIPSVDREIARIEKMLAGWYRKHPMSMTCPVARFRRDGAESLLSIALERLAKRGRIEILTGGLIRDPARKDSLTSEERALLERMVEWLEAAGARSRSRAEVLEHFGKQGAELLERLLEESQAVAVGPTFVWGGRSYGKALEIVTEICGEVGGELDIPSLRDRLGTSRKFLIPFLEHLDRVGITARKGNRRILRLATGHQAG
ncbi:MAG: selenocysteine-specific translation elongation factor [Planctomycetota bacterium]